VTAEETTIERGEGALVDVAQRVFQECLYPEASAMSLPLPEFWMQSTVVTVEVSKFDHSAKLSLQHGLSCRQDDSPLERQGSSAAYLQLLVELSAVPHETFELQTFRN
jgi:hypothetical protein